MLEHFPLSASEFDGPVLVTGAGGCIGSWVLTLLTHAGVPVSAFDLKADTRRPALLMSEADLNKVHWYEGDIADTAAVKAAVQHSKACAIIHLAVTTAQCPWPKA